MLRNVEIFCIRHTFDMSGASRLMHQPVRIKDERSLEMDLLSDVSVAQEIRAGALVCAAFGVHSVFQTGCCICECISVCLLMSETTVDTIEIYSFTSDQEAKPKCPCE